MDGETWVNLVSDFIQQTGFPIFVATAVLIYAGKFGQKLIEELAKVRQSVDRLTDYMIERGFDDE